MHSLFYSENHNSFNFRNDKLFNNILDCIKCTDAEKEVFCEFLSMPPSNEEDIISRQKLFDFFFTDDRE